MNARGTSASGEGVLAGAIARIVELKREHDPLLRQIASDAGMSAATREMLVAHLVEEEDAAVAALERASVASPSAGSPSAAASSATSSWPTTSSLTTSPRPLASVGSMRREEPPLARVGSLRGTGPSS